MAPKLLLSVLLTLLFQTLTLSMSAKVTTPTTPVTTTTVDPEIPYNLRHIARVRMIELIKDFNQTRTGYARLLNEEIDYVAKGVAEIWKKDPMMQASEAFKIIVENNHFLYPELRSFKSFDWLVKFIRQVNVGKSVLKKESTLYKCLMANYTPCMAEAGTNKIAKILQKFECSYRFFTDGKYDDYRIANPELHLLDFNAFSE